MADANVAITGFGAVSVPLAADTENDSTSTSVHYQAMVTRRFPGSVLTLRSAIAAADGTTKPAAANAIFTTGANPSGREKARVSVTTTGTPTTCTLRTYLRTGGSGGEVLTGDLVSLNGTPNYDAGFDVQTDGDDLCIYVETLSGGSSPTVTVKISWR